VFRFQSNLYLDIFEFEPKAPKGVIAWESFDFATQLWFGRSTCAQIGAVQLYDSPEWGVSISF
jgi:hypothetical protein